MCRKLKLPRSISKKFSGSNTKKSEPPDGSSGVSWKKGTLRTLKRTAPLTGCGRGFSSKIPSIDKLIPESSENGERTPFVSKNVDSITSSYLDVMRSVLQTEGLSVDELQRYLDLINRGYLELIDSSISSEKLSVKDRMRLIADIDKSFNEWLDNVFEANIRGLTNKQKNDKLFTLWADDYNEHMISTGHHYTISMIMRWLSGIDGVGHWKDEPVLGKRIMELSCGTGAVLGMILEEEPDREGLMTANDINREMRKKAVDNLGRKISELKGETALFHGNPDEAVGMLQSIENPGKMDVVFTNMSMGDIGIPKEKYDTVILSQTIHLLTDMEKEQAIKKAVKLLKEGGTFILIDEFPAKLTTTQRPVGLNYMTSKLFDSVFHPINEKPEVRMVWAGEMPELSFEMELKEMIDYDHSMYAFVFRKKGKAPKTRSHEEVEKTILEAFEKIMEGKEGSDARKRILNWELHSQRLEETEQKIIKEFRELPVGGWIILMDEFVGGGAPPHLSQNCRYPLDRSRLREEIMRRSRDGEHKMWFEGELSIRLNGSSGRRAYGFLYRKIERWENKKK